MSDLSPGQDVRVSGMSGGDARVVYVSGNNVRVRMASSGKERTVPPESVTPKRESKALSAPEPDALDVDRRFSIADMPDRDAAANRAVDSYERRHPLRPVPKPVTLTSPAYLAYVRKHPCCLCGRSEGIEAHHWSHHGGVMGAKVDDYRTVPLCQEHHRYWHDHGMFPRHDRPESEAIMLRAQRELILACADRVGRLLDGDMVDALIRAIGGADA